MIAVGFVMSMTAPIEVLYALRFGPDGISMTAYVMVSAVGVLAVDVFGTRFVPRLEARGALMTGILIFGASSVVLGVSPVFAPLLIGRVAQGAASAIIGGTALQASVRGKARRGHALGSMQSRQLLGSAFGAPLGGVLAGLLPGTAGYRLAFAVCALSCVLVVVAIRLTLPPLPTSGRPRIGLPGFSGPSVAGMALVLGILGNYLRSGVEYTALPLVGNAHGLSTITIGVALGLLAAVEIVTLRISGHLFERFEPARCLLGALILGLAAAALLMLSSGRLAFLSAGLLFGLVDGIALAAPPVLIMALMADTISGLASYRIACGLGSLVGSTSVNVTVATLGAAGGLSTVGGVLVGGVALVIAIARRIQTTQSSDTVRGR